MGLGQRILLTSSNEHDGKYESCVPSRGPDEIQEALIRTVPRYILFHIIIFSSQLTYSILYLLVHPPNNPVYFVYTIIVVIEIVESFRKGDRNSHVFHIYYSLVQGVNF